MSDHDQHSSFIKTPQQLVVVLVLSFVVPIVGIILLVKLVTSHQTADPNALTAEAIAARIAPVGRVEFGAPGGSTDAAQKPAAEQPAAAAAGKPAAVDGKSVYDKACVACHAAGVANAPKLGDKAAWAPRVAQGMDAMLQSVIKGKGAMPPKAGNPALSDAELRAGVEFMVSQSK